jgi:hypothetical protein
MNKQEALQILRSHLERYRHQSYGELVGLIDKPQTGKLNGPSGTKYQTEVQVFWDDKPGEAIRVLGAIDDGGLSAFIPLTDDFILDRNGNFIGE